MWYSICVLISVFLGNIFSCFSAVEFYLFRIARYFFLRALFILVILIIYHIFGKKCPSLICLLHLPLFVVFF